MKTTDHDIASELSADPYHKGLVEHGKFRGFRNEMSDEEITVAQVRLDRIFRPSSFTTDIPKGYLWRKL